MKTDGAGSQGEQQSASQEGGGRAGFRLVSDGDLDAPELRLMSTHCATHLYNLNRSSRVSKEQEITVANLAESTRKPSSKVKAPMYNFNVFDTLTPSPQRQ